MKCIAFCLLLWVSSGLAWAGGALQGTVVDSRGHPIKGAEIRIEGKKFTKSVKADAKGHYFSDGLTTDTAYKVSLIVDGSVKASVQNIRARAEKPAEVNFDLRVASKPAKKRMVWVADPPTGTHIGPAGHWVEVDENGVPVDNSRNNPELIRMGSDYAKQLELSGGNKGGSGH